VVAIICLLPFLPFLAFFFEVQIQQRQIVERKTFSLVFTFPPESGGIGRPPLPDFLGLPD
jgi:hypothetical protein